MQTRLIMQKEGENTVANILAARFEMIPKKVYFFCGNLKENGFKLIEDELIGYKGKTYFAIGIDKKNTTKTMLEDMLRYTKDVYIYSNNGNVEFNAGAFVFEYASKAYLYVVSSNISENGLSSDISIYVETIFDLEVSKEKAEYKLQIKNMINEVEELGFQKLTTAYIDELLQNKEIFSTNQYIHKVKSISELLGSETNHHVKDSKTLTKQDIDDVYVSDISIPKIDLSDISIDIDLSDVEEVTKESKSKNKPIEKEEITFDTLPEEEVESVENLKEIEQLKEESIEKDHNAEIEEEFDVNEALDINELLLSKADIKLEPKKKEQKIENVSENNEENQLNEFSEEEIIQSKKINLNHVSNVIFELPSRTSKGQDMNSIKIPNYLKTMIPAFFELNEKGKNIEENGMKYKVRDINVEVVDVAQGTKYTDREAKMVYKNGQSYFTFVTNTLKNIQYNENDIVRIIKLASDIYHIEIIAKELQEYKLWNKVCNQKFKSSERRFGLM